MNYISILATDNETKVKVTLPNANSGESTLLINGSKQLYNGPFEIDLNQYESYIIATTSSNTDPVSNRFALIGGLIQSVDNNGVEDNSKPIVVNVGSANGKHGTENFGMDQGIDQIVPVNKVGFEYIFVRGNGTDAVEGIIVIADRDNTKIYLGDDSTHSYELDAGEFKIITGSNYSTQTPGGTLYIRTQGEDNPIFAYQIIGGGGKGINGCTSCPEAGQANLGLFFVPALSESAQDDIDNIAYIDRIGATAFSGSNDAYSGVSIVYLDSAPPTIYSSDSGNIDLATLTVEDVVGRDEYSAVTIPDLKGNISVKSDDQLYVSYYNRNAYKTSGGFYAGFSSAPKYAADPEIDILGNCIVLDDAGDFVRYNGELKVTNSEGFDTWIWQKYDDISSSFTDITDTNDLTEYIPESASDYRIKGTINCLGLDLFSPTIVVNICPDDFDEDGIIDNIDLDHDNDGILNSIESKGTGTINFSDLENPTITLDASGASVNDVTISGTVDDSKVTDPLSGVTGMKWVF